MTVDWIYPYISVAFVLVGWMALVGVTMFVVLNLIYKQFVGFDTLMKWRAAYLREQNEKRRQSQTDAEQR